MPTWVNVDLEMKNVADGHPDRSVHRADGPHRDITVHISEGWALAERVAREERDAVAAPIKVRLSAKPWGYREKLTFAAGEVARGGITVGGGRKNSRSPRRSWESRS
jgi:hypothetical protein